MNKGLSGYSFLFTTEERLSLPFMTRMWQGLARQHFISGHQHRGRKRAARQTKPIPPNAAEHLHMFLFT